MAASSSITSPFFMLAASSSWKKKKYSTNKSKICMQQFEGSSTKGDHQHELTLDRNLKMKLQAQAALVHGETSLTSMIESLKDNDDMTIAPAKMEHLTLEGRLIKGGRIFQQNHLIRSFEIDPYYRVSSRAIMNFLQEASVNHRKKMGMSSDVLYGITPEMSKRDLIWVFRSMCIEVDSYPSWADVIQVNHWFCMSGRTGMRLHWIIFDIKTGETLVRASCLIVMMNKKTRKTCKFPEEVKQELNPFLTIDAEPMVEDFKNSSPEVEKMNCIRNGLTPGWHDLDNNYHVNNAKYLDWILESIPPSFIYTHELRTINLEYRKECFKDDVIESLSRVVIHESGADDDDDHLLINNGEVELQHLLRLQSGPEVVRAKTAWRPKSICRKAYN